MCRFQSTREVRIIVRNWPVRPDRRKTRGDGPHSRSISASLPAGLQMPQMRPHLFAEQAYGTKGRLTALKRGYKIEHAGAELVGDIANLRLHRFRTADEDLAGRDPLVDTVAQQHARALLRKIRAVIPGRGH